MLNEAKEISQNRPRLFGSSEEVKQLPTSERKRISDKIDSWAKGPHTNSPNSWRSLGVRSQVKRAADRKTLDGVAIAVDPIKRIVEQLLMHRARTVPKCNVAALRNAGATE